MTTQRVHQPTPLKCSLLIPGIRHHVSAFYLLTVIVMTISFRGKLLHFALYLNSDNNLSMLFTLSRLQIPLEPIQATSVSKLNYDTNVSEIGLSLSNHQISSTYTDTTVTFSESQATTKSAPVTASTDLYSDSVESGGFFDGLWGCLRPFWTVIGKNKGDDRLSGTFCITSICFNQIK